MKHIYRPERRPMSFSTLPPDVTWDYIEAPASFTIARTDLPRSRYPYGIVWLSRRLTLAESDRYEMLWLGEIP